MSSTAQTTPALRDVLPTWQIANWLKDVRIPAERSRQLAKLNGSEIRQLGAILDARTAEELLDSVDDELAAHALSALDPGVAAPLVDALDIDHATEVLREMKDPAREAVLSALPA